MNVRWTSKTSGQKFKIQGNLPSPVFRAYEHQQYSADFAERGHIRLGSLLSYREIESLGRRDTSEGEPKLRIPSDVTTIFLESKTLQRIGESVAPGYLNYSGSFDNPLYAFCVADSTVHHDHLRRQFGCHIVEIFNTTAFLVEFKNSLSRLQLPDREVLFVDSCSVRYDKGEIGEYPKDDHDRIYYTQKPPDFASDCEWRVVIALTGPLKEAPKELFLDLANPKLFCRQMSIYQNPAPTAQTASANGVLP